MRTCVGCRESFPQKQLVRIVRTPEGGITVDLKGKMNGRGAYICRQKSCLDKAVKKGSIERTLNTAVPAEIYERLIKELESDET